MGKGHFVYILSFDMIMINVALSKKHQLYSMQKANLFANIHYFYFINHRKKDQPLCDWSYIRILYYTTASTLIFILLPSYKKALLLHLRCR